MRSFVLVSVVLGVALGAPQGFPLDTPEVSAARQAFIAEYNRLAELAAAAPDIHIYHEDPRDRLQRLQTSSPHLANPAVPSVPSVPAFNDYSFSASLGNNQQFVPGPNTFPSAGHLAGHLAGHQAPAHPAPAPARAPAPAPHRFQVPDAPVARWTGPVADTVPAGLGGRTTETESVVAAKDAHFRAHAAALGQLTRF
ncbi:uncharacterized protein LOC122243993 [Penaeus japonicus]|uniref:uncharacterized protein LOC122243993 n=1 Tax=Penaeus japonicus TaxID=27405 RepID=UPI001C70F108|nr:uncharacterized protein LOC122243993 [Penaeus japonicus]